MKSMTGYSAKEMRVAPLGKVCLEVRSANHKFLETVFHLPPGFLSLEEKIKKEVEARIKRGRVVCVMTILGGAGSKISINRGLLKDYIAVLKAIGKGAGIKDQVRLDTLVHLPGVLSLAEDKSSPNGIWPALKVLVERALDELVAMRQREGRALYGYLKARAKILENNLSIIRNRFNKVIKEKTRLLATQEECAGLLRDTDITEEIERLAFHIKSFSRKLAQLGSVGKELDFIAQEMQREANTMGAKSCDTLVSARVVQIKSQVEKVREQLQNVE